MSERSVDILLVESDAELCEMLIAHIEKAIGCHVTAVGTAAEAMREELTTRHGLIILSADLPDDEDFSLLREIRLTNDCPVIVLTGETRVEQAVEALQHCVMRWFEKPFDISELTNVVNDAIELERDRRRERVRYRRLRKIAGRIIREREDLNQRMELLCRDLVSAYRQLAEKVTEAGILTEK